MAAKCHFRYMLMVLFLTIRQELYIKRVNLISCWLSSFLWSPLTQASVCADERQIVFCFSACCRDLWQLQTHTVLWVCAVVGIEEVSVSKRKPANTAADQTSHRSNSTIRELVLLFCWNPIIAALPLCSHSSLSKPPKCRTQRWIQITQMSGIC